VISRKARLSAVAGGTFVAIVVALALVPFMIHREEVPSSEPSASVNTSGSQLEDSTLRLPALDETIAGQGTSRPLAAPLASPSAAAASAVR